MVDYYKNIPNHTTIEELPADNATYIKNALPNVNDCSCMLGNNENSYWHTDGCKSLTSIDSTDWDVSNIKNMSCMFGNCRSLTTLDLSKWNTSNVHDMSYMFYYCLRLKTLDVSNLDTSKVTNMSYMFYDCASLTSLDISNWDTSMANMTSMFQYWTSLRTITGVIDMKSCTSYSNPFEHCNNLSRVKITNHPSSFARDGFNSY